MADNPDCSVIGKSSTFLNSTYSAYIQSCLQQGCYHREYLTFTHLDGYHNLSELGRYIKDIE